MVRGGQSRLTPTQLSQRQLALPREEELPIPLLPTEAALISHGWLTEVKTSHANSLCMDGLAKLKERQSLYGLLLGGFKALRVSICWLELYGSFEMVDTIIFSL